jgi:hypothetical protein
MARSFAFEFLFVALRANGLKAATCFDFARSRLHIMRNLFSSLAQVRAPLGVGRLLVVSVAVRTAGSQWRFEIR